MAANLHTKPIDSGCESAKNWLLPSTSSIAIVITTQPISSYSVFYHPTKNRRLSRPRHCSKGAQAMPRLYVASFVVNTTVCRTFVFSHCSQMHQPLGNCDLLVLAHPGSPGQRAIKRVCVCVCERKCMETKSPVLLHARCNETRSDNVNPFSRAQAYVMFLQKML